MFLWWIKTNCVAQIGCEKKYVSVCRISPKLVTVHDKWNIHKMVMNIIMHIYICSLPRQNMIRVWYVFLTRPNMIRMWSRGVCYILLYNIGVTDLDGFIFYDNYMCIFCYSSSQRSHHDSWLWLKNHWSQLNNLHSFI